MLQTPTQMSWTIQTLPSLLWFRMWVKVKWSVSIVGKASLNKNRSYGHCGKIQTGTEVYILQETCLCILSCSAIKSYISSILETCRSREKKNKDNSYFKSEVIVTVIWSKCSTSQIDRRAEDGVNSVATYDTRMITVFSTTARWSFTYVFFSLSHTHTHAWSEKCVRTGSSGEQHSYGPWATLVICPFCPAGCPGEILISLQRSDPCNMRLVSLSCGEFHLTL